MALIWNVWLLATIEMGDFHAFRPPFLIALPIGYILVIRFVDEFLAVRAAGNSLSDGRGTPDRCRILRYELSRLVVTVFAYVVFTPDCSG